MGNCTDVEMESSEVNSSDAESDSVIIGFTGDAVTRELRVPTSEEPKAPPAPPVPPPLCSVVAPAVGGAGPEDVLHPRSPTPRDERSNLRCRRPVARQSPSSPLKQIPITTRGYPASN